MATFDARIHPLAFAHMESGEKTVYVVPATAEYSMVTAGDRLEDEAIGSITVGIARRYPDLVKLMAAEGFANVIPEANDDEDAITLLRRAPGWSEMAVEREGVFALRVRSAKRKS